MLTPAQIKPKSFESRQNSSSFFYPGWICARLLPQSYQYRNLSEGADRVGGQLRGDKECPFSGVTKSGRVWRKVPESDARSVGRYMYALGFWRPLQDFSAVEFCPRTSVGILAYADRIRTLKILKSMSMFDGL